jgi:flagellar biosynthesis chaperone FliJ
MKTSWENLDINQLQHLYHEYSRQLERRLLHGASWDEVAEQRQDVTALAVTIYKRLNPHDSNPAENNLRSDE